MVADEKNINILKEELMLLELPSEAINWLLGLYDVIQAFDDVKDKDNNLDDNKIYNLIFNSMIALPTNTFYLANIVSLANLVNLQVLKWIASNKVEEKKEVDAKSFMWRAGYFDIVLHVVFLCKGFDFTSKNAHLILSIYGEKLQDYLKGFEICQTQ